MMTIKQRRRWIYTIATCVLVIGAAWQSVAEENSSVEFSDAETLLWMTDQLKTIDKPLELHYDFERTGTYDAGFSDTVKFIVQDVNEDGTKSASVEFFTGERRFEVPSVERTNVNPILKIYLQGDVYEMNRLTDPDGESRERWRYFQRRIKFAMADAATVEDVTVSFGGKELTAKKISFRPYAKDPKRNLFEQYADKVYTVVVSEAVPGYLFRISTVVPAPIAGAPPLIREVLQIADIRDESS